MPPAHHRERPRHVGGADALTDVGQAGRERAAMAGAHPLNGFALGLLARQTQPVVRRVYALLLWPHPARIGAAGEADRAGVRSEAFMVVQATETELGPEPLFGGEVYAFKSGLVTVDGQDLDAKLDSDADTDAAINLPYSLHKTCAAVVMSNARPEF